MDRLLHLEQLDHVGLPFTRESQPAFVSICISILNDTQVKRDKWLHLLEPQFPLLRQGENSPASQSRGEQYVKALGCLGVGRRQTAAALKCQAADTIGGAPWRRSPGTRDPGGGPAPGGPGPKDCVASSLTDTDEGRAACCGRNGQGAASARCWLRTRAQSPWQPLPHMTPRTVWEELGLQSHTDLGSNAG